MFDEESVKTLTAGASVSVADPLVVMARHVSGGKHVHTGQHSADPRIGNETSHVPRCLKPLQRSHMTTVDGFNDHVDRHSHPVGGVQCVEGHHSKRLDLLRLGRVQQPSGCASSRVRGITRSIDLVGKRGHRSIPGHDLKPPTTS